MSGPFSCCILSRSHPPGSLSKQLPGNVKNPQTCRSSCLCFISQPAAESTQPRGYASSTVRPGVTACCCEFCHSKWLQAFVSGCPLCLKACFIHPKLPGWRSPYPHWYWCGDFICTLCFVLLTFITHFKVEPNQFKEFTSLVLSSVQSVWHWFPGGRLWGGGQERIKEWAFSFLCLHIQKKSKILFKLCWK